MTVYAAQSQPTVIEDFKPSTLNQPGKEYPKVNSQGYAQFRIEAPEAQSVSVSLGLGGKGGTKLAKTDDGSWMGTTGGPMDEGFHYYHLTIDGGTFNDPGALNFYGSTRWESGIEIPAHDQDFYALKDVPHVTCSRSFSRQRAQKRRVVHLSIPRQVTIRSKKNVFRCCICNMAGARMKPRGVTRGMPI